MTGLFKRDSRKTAAPTAAPLDVRMASKVFPRFLAALSHQPSPVLVDLGPVVGSNVSFFGDRFGGTIHVEDLVADVEAHARGVDPRPLGQVFAVRPAREPGTVDGVLCWDLFDFLDRAAGQMLAGRLARALRGGGVLYGLFGTTPIDLRHYTRFVVEGDGVLRQRPYPATMARRQVLSTRDINKMFDGLAVAESVLLKSRTREILFRKP